MYQVHDFCPFYNKYKDWDYLIILDACRYDFFEAFYNFFFKGQLVRAKSVASCTYDYCIKCLMSRNHSNIIYISANPYINSKFAVGKCNVKHIFNKVVDVWLYGWSERFGTVLPETVNKFAMSVISKFKKKGTKFVIHYLQPHAPYLSRRVQKSVLGYGKPTTTNLLFGTTRYRNNLFLTIEKKILNAINIFEILGVRCLYSTYTQLRNFIGLPPLSPVDNIRRMFGTDILRIAYAENLLLVLAYAAILVNNIRRLDSSARVVITSDHGEFLGEKCSFEHPCGMRDQEVRTVPYFIVDDINISLANKYALKRKLELIFVHR